MVLQLCSCAVAAAVPLLHEGNAIRGQLVLRRDVFCGHVALLARVAVRAAVAAVPANVENHPATHHAAGAGVCPIGVVQMEQNHLTGVLRTTQRVELVMPELAHLQEGVSRVYEGRGDVGVGVACVTHDTAS
mgnify:CR=1 FL=1